MEGMKVLLKVGMIGIGRMGNWHAAKLASLEDVEIIATSTSPIETVKFDQKKPKQYDNYEEMLENEELDIVYICTPTKSHVDIAKKVVNKKINLFLEKPIALNLKEAWELVQQVKQSKIICTVGYMYRYRNIVRKLKKLFENRPISLLNGHWYWTIPPVSHIKDKNIGGGPIVDQLTHLIDLCRLLGGEIKTVNAKYTLNTRLDESFNNWDGYVINLEFERGSVASISGTLSLFETLGEQTMLENVVLDVSAKDLFARFTPKDLTIYTDGKMDIYQDNSGEINEEFIRACRENEQSLIQSPIEDAMKTLAVTLAANHSHHTGNSVVMEEYYKAELGYYPFSAKANI